jgi:hypothetical protein
LGRDRSCCRVFFSSGTPEIHGIHQAIAYTAYLLEQRPDRVAVFGLYIWDKCFSLILVDATNVYYTTGSWGEESERELLFRVLYYVNDPPASVIDPTITNKKDGTFSIKVGDDGHPDCEILFCQHPIGRRTVTFLNRNNDSFPIIKEQYLRCRATATEAEVLEESILNRIHEPDEVPGVVRVGWCGLVKRPDQSSVECGEGDWKRQKARLVLLDAGIPFMEINNPYDALVTAWDALEGE